MGRPVGSTNQKESVRFSKTLFKTICDRIAAGESLRSICREEGMPSHNAVVQWVMDDREGCSSQYTRAREVQAQGMIEEIFTISDDSSNDVLFVKPDGTRVMNKEFVARSRLRFDARRWYVSKVLPKIYGDKLDLNHAGKVEINLTGASLLLARAKAEAAESPDDDEAEEETSDLQKPQR